jgi:hypothetical protein
VIVVGLVIVAALVPLTTAGASTSVQPVDVADESGIFEVTTSWSLAAADVDGDGLDDLLLGRHLEPARLYRNLGGRFVEVQAGTFPARDRHDCDWADVDQDGRVDAYCSIGARHGTATKANELWIQQADHTFVDRASAFGVADPYGRGRRVTFIDVNHDAYPDLFVGNLFPRQDDVLSSNRLFINRGGTRFREAPRFGLTEEVGAGCAQAADVDGDGWEDLLLCGVNSLRLYRNVDGERFVDVSDVVGIGGKTRSALLEDLDGDDLPDLIQAQGHSVWVRLQRQGRFAIVAHEVALEAGARIAVGDADGDLRPDAYLVTGCGSRARNAPDVLLRNLGGGDFEEIEVALPSEGCGDVAVAIDHDLDGRDAFVVANGRGYVGGERVSGPVQLIAFGPDG